MIDLYWLPAIVDWAERLEAARELPAAAGWKALVGLSRARLDLARTERLARSIKRLCGTAPPEGIAAAPIRLALLGSSTVEHLIPSIRVAGLRRDLWIDVYATAYGQYFQELADTKSPLHAFAPTAIVFSLDARHLIASAATKIDAPAADAELERTLDHLGDAWRMAREIGARVFQQTAVPVFPSLLGANEHRLCWSPRRLTAEFNARLRGRADAAGVDLISLDEAIERDGIGTWHDPSHWHRTKQEVHPAAAQIYGELVVRMIAARIGCSAKCLVLDLDNTLWGGVIGDDGLGGIELGQGSAIGEAHLALQAYARDLSRRGIILAVCSKNDETNALEAFEKHPEMLLRRADVGCFMANWQDKATNLRAIAAGLNIGLDSLVFVDDSPFERNIVRRELPMVAVPELPEEPASFVRCIADAGYFEAPAITEEDTRRAELYRANAQRETARGSVTDLASYLKTLGMKMRWRSFDAVGCPRIAQLINKSNQFNLTTRRYSESEILALIDDPDALTFQFRLVDAFGDNGMISVIICRRTSDPVAEIDTWLMSCRVLGRGVEQAALNTVIDEAKSVGIAELYGRYLPTGKNGLVAQHYENLGFRSFGQGEDGAGLWRLDVASFKPFSVPMQTVRG